MKFDQKSNLDLWIRKNSKKYEMFSLRCLKLSGIELGLVTSHKQSQWANQNQQLEATVHDLEAENSEV